MESADAAPAAWLRDHAYVRSRLLPIKRVELKDAILGYVAISFFYQAMLVPIEAAGLAIANLSSPFGTWLHSRQQGWILSPEVSGIGKALALIMSSLALPAAIGLVAGLDADKGWSRAFMRRRGVNLNHPIDVAWDWKLGQEECWVHVTLKDGTKWAGHLGVDSFSSTDPSERDLYIDDVHDTGKDDKVWVARGTGIWIAHGEIQSIEFWPYHLQQADDEQDDGDGGRESASDSGGPAADAGQAAKLSAGSGETSAPEPSAGRQEVAITLELKGIAVVEEPKRN